MIGFAVVLSATRAVAFCRTTTCDVSAVELSDHPECLPDERDADQCNLKGASLYWPGQCVSFGVQENGSKLRGITWEVTDSLVRRAFGAWTGVDCGAGRHPSLKIYDLDEVDGPIVCPVIEFNKTAPNANVYLYRDDEWPYGGGANALAITTTTFDESGRILDADVEINTFSEDFTTSDTAPGNDLQSILTHETGHFLGLAHEKLARATMNTFYQPDQPFDFRSVEADDVSGICTIYPPGRDAPDCANEPSPLHGFSRYCGDENDIASVRSELSMRNGGGCACSLEHSEGRSNLSAFFLLAAAAVGSRRLSTRKDTLDVSSIERWIRRSRHRAE